MHDISDEDSIVAAIDRLEKGISLLPFYRLRFVSAKCALYCFLGIQSSYPRQSLTSFSIADSMSLNNLT